MSPSEKKNFNLKQKQSQDKHRLYLTEQQKEQLKHTEKKRKSTKHCDDISISINTFRNTIQDGPNYTCVSCCKFLFRRAVTVFNRNRYRKSSLNLIEMFLASETNTNSHDKMYICHPCDTSRENNQIPVICSVNGMHLETVPDQLNDLSSVELHKAYKGK